MVEASDRYLQSIRAVRILCGLQSATGSSIRASELPCAASVLRLAITLAMAVPKCCLHEFLNSLIAYTTPILYRTQ